jgi:beta-barrel assembly-enhancing protease
MTDDTTGNEPSFGGILFGPRWRSGVPCRVSLAAGRLDARAAGGDEAAIPFAAMRLSFTGEGDKYVDVSDGSAGGVRVLVADRGLVAQLERAGLPRDALSSLRVAEAGRRGRRARRAGALVAVAAVLGALALALWLALRWAVGEAVDAVPPTWEREIGRSAAAAVLSETAVCTDPELGRAVEEIGRRLVAGLGVTPYSWKLRVLDAEEVNAFALPGGYVFVNRGLVLQASDGDEVAGVIAHELEHVVRRHGIHNVARQLGTVVALRALLGDLGAVEQALAGNAASLASMSFSRDQEREADRLGLELVRRARLDTTGLERFMRALAAEEGKLGSALSFLSTHPASEERARDLAEIRRAWKTPEREPLTADWAAAKAECVPVAIADPDAV